MELDLTVRYLDELAVLGVRVRGRVRRSPGTQ